jgi:hypothetical protein
VLPVAGPGEGKEMNYYLFFPFSSILINVFAWSYIYAQKQDTAVNKTCLIFWRVFWDGSSAISWYVVAYPPIGKCRS